MSEGDDFCRACGAKLSTKVARVTPAKPKDRGVTLLLAILIGLIGFYGMGHVYLGRVGRGIAFLIADWVVGAIGIFCMFVFWPLAAIFFLGSLGLFLWQIFDADALVKRYNRTLEETGDAPW